MVYPSARAFHSIGCLYLHTGNERTHGSVFIFSHVPRAGYIFICRFQLHVDKQCVPLPARLARAIKLTDRKYKFHKTRGFVDEVRASKKKATVTRHREFSVLPSRRYSIRRHGK